MRPRGPVILCALLLVAPGCISRHLIVESDPPGAEVRLNGRPAGKTPLRVPFRHYGVYRVELRKEGYATMVATEEIRAPWYAWFPLCLFTELVLPARIFDERWRSYALSRPSAPDRDELLQRAEGRAD